MNHYEQATESVPYQSPPTARTLNWLGVSSVVIGILAGITEFLIITFAGIRHANATSAGTTVPESENMIIGFVALGGLALAALGIAMGIGSLFLPRRGKISGITGTIVNALVFLAVILLIIIGLLAG